MKITYQGQKREITEGVRIKEAFAKEIAEAELPIIAARLNNYVFSLNHKIQEEGEIELLDIRDNDGMRTYIRGLLYIMGKAFKEVYPETDLIVNYQLHNAMYCDSVSKEITEEMLKNVNDRMQEIVEKNLEITKVTMTKAEAEAFYAKEQTENGKLQLEAKQKDNVSLYYCEEYYNYFYGVMPISTGILQLFEMKKYQKGFLIRYPSRRKPTELQPYIEGMKLLTALQEYEDIHRILGIDTVHRLNEIVRKGKISETILIDEALHEKKLSDLADQIASRKNIKMVLIAGPSSSGKTTFAKRLGIQLRLNGIRPVTISVDNYFVEREDTPKDEHGNYDFERIDAIDLNLFNDHLLKLLNGERIFVPKFNFETGKKEYSGETMHLDKDEILVIEGIHCLNDILTSKIPREQKYKIYISDLTVLNIDGFNRISTTDSRLIRRMVRDFNYRGYSAMHTLKMWYSVNRGEEKYIFPFQEQADTMFNTSLVYELGVLKDYAIPLLKQITTASKEYSEAIRLLDLLRYFESIPADDIPKNSLLREFIGGSIFGY